MKKPFYKRWWFWVILVILVFALFGSGGNKNNVATPPAPSANPSQGAQAPAPTPAPATAAKDDVWNKAGMYKVGPDIPSGEYLLMSATALPAYFQVSKDSTGSLESIITNDNFEGSRYVTLADGQYFEVRDAKFAAIDKAPKQAPANGVYGPGMYKVGRDIEPGEYKLKPTAGATAYFEVAKDSRGALDSIVSNDNFNTEKYITIKAGQYIKINACQLSK